MVEITSDLLILQNRDINFLDMHHHSTASDGTMSAKTLARIFKKKKLGLCITDHNQIKGSVYLAKKTNIFTIPSIEVTTKESNDVLVYFYDVSDLESFWENEIRYEIRNNKGLNLNKTQISVFDLPEKVKEYNGLSFLAHPIMPKVFGIFQNPKDSSYLVENKQFRKKIDGFESHNFSTNFSDESVAKLRKYNMPLIGGSDSHIVSLFNILTGSETFERSDFLDNLLKKKNVIFFQKGNNMRRFIEQATIMKNNINFK